MANQPIDRLAVLAARVVWLDRYRRAIAITLAFALFVLITYELGFLGGVVSVLFCWAVWWLVEVALAWLTAFWETEHAQLTRDRGLPRAELVRRRR